MESPRILSSSLEKLICILASSVAMSIGLATLVGWTYNIPRMTDWAGDGISMFANPALCVVLSGASIQILACTRNRHAVWIARLLAMVVNVIALLTIVEHLSGVNLGVDTLLVAREWGQNGALSPMRMGIPASASLLLLGSALMLASFGSFERRIASLLVVPVIAITCVSLIGYVFGANLLYGIAGVTAIARQTGASILFLAIGIISLIPEHGFQCALNRNDAGGIILRRLLLPAAGVPLLLNGLRIVAVDAGYFDEAFGTAVVTIIEVLLFAMLLYLTASKVSRQASRIAEIEMRLESVLATGEVGIWELDIQSGMITVDKSLIKLLGMSPSTAVRRPVREILECIASDDRGRVQDVLHHAMTQGGNWEVEFPLKSGNWMVARGRVEKNAFGAPAFMPGVFFDVTQRKHSEEQIVQANKNKDKFLATLAHELRNPLSPVASSIYLLRDMLSSNKEAVELANIAERHVKQLIRLVDDLLDVSRISLGKVVLQKSVCRLQEIIEQAVESIQQFLEASDHSLELNLPEAGVYVHGDATRLTQVVTNILNNAAKYTPPGGKITVSLTANAGMAVIHVIDNGIGIAPESLKRVFGLFTQLDERDTSGKGGLGVGLALVKQLVELHGGQISLESDGEGCGARVRIEIPTAPTELCGNHSKTSNATRAIAAHTCRVLVVDDMRANTLTLSRLLSRMGHQVQAVNNGESALEILDSFHPDVIISDVSMPGMNGYELAKAVRNRCGSSIQLVALTGFGAPNDRDESLSAGFDFHMVKPPDVKVLISYFESLALLSAK